MRIVGGKYKSRVLSGFEGDKIRPTSDKTRESLFNILQNRIYGAEFLDLFCGTGAMGIEALSRGAKFVTFNDADRNSLNLLRKNLEKLKVTEDYQIKNYDALVFLKNADKKYDIIFIDPPYKTDLGERAIASILNSLKDDGVAILESETPFTGAIDGLKVVDERKYGRARLTFFEKGE